MMVLFNSAYFGILLMIAGTIIELTLMLKCIVHPEYYAWLRAKTVGVYTVSGIIVLGFLVFNIVAQELEFKDIRENSSLTIITAGTR